MIRMERILCQVDLSELSQRAFLNAAALARWYDARIKALYVVPQVLPHPLIAPAYPTWVALNPEAREQLLGELRRFVESAAERTETDIREGEVVDEILVEADSLPADLVVMGTHGRGGFERWVLGSVTEKVLRKAACPVMTIPTPFEPTGGPVVFNRILCALDFSEASLNALRYALSLAQENDAELVLLHAVEWLVEDQPGAEPPLFDVPEYRRHLERDARERLHGAVPEEARNWCRPVEVLVAGRAWKEILRVARERQVQLIVMGVHGRSVVDLMLFGSTTHHVIRSAGCPVLTIRKG